MRIGIWIGENNMEKKDNALKALRITRVFRCIGPAIIIAASIIGPGTVTTASSTGAEYGYALLWCSVISAILDVYKRQDKSRG